MARRPARSGAELTRTIEVRPLSFARETGAVIRAILLIGFWAAMLIGAERGTGGPGRPGAAPGPVLPPDEIAVASLPAADQRLFNLVREGIAAAEQHRGRTGAWPTVEALAARGVPPFATDPIDRGGYQWSLRRDGLVLAYLGVPAAGSGRASFAIVIAEPEPGTPADPTTPVDEVHHRLSDGTLIHVTVWRTPDRRTLSAAVISPPLEDGWQAVTIGP
jgi:hypothetical protein